MDGTVTATAANSASGTWQASGTLARLTLAGHLDAHTLGDIWHRVRAQQADWLSAPADLANSQAGAPYMLSVDLAQVAYLDGAGMAFLIDLQHAQETVGAKTELLNLDARYQPLMAQYQPFESLYPPPVSNHRPHNSLIERVGKATEAIFEDIRHQVTFIGQLASNLAGACRNPRSVRWNDFVGVGVEAGVAALPIVSLVAFLIGVILAFQSAIGLKQFGAETFVANLVSLSIFRELGPLMTAILLAGRSSAAFAAEIGTMTVNNEVDALVTGGIDPIRFLVLPRLLAGLLVAPILSLFSDLIGIFAASLTMLAYQVPCVTFYEAVLKTIHFNDIMSGLTKSLLFGLIISGVGCLRGMETGTGAAAVGLSATRAVVTSLILIVMVDGLFAYISYKTGF